MRRSEPVCRQVKILLGVHVLGGLRGHQEARVRAHLARCARCRAEYEELAEVPALLDMITAEEAAEAEKLHDQAPAVDERAKEPAEQAGSDGAEVPFAAPAGTPGRLSLVRDTRPSRWATSAPS